MDIQWDKHAKFLSGHQKLGHGPVERNVNLFPKNELDLHFFLKLCPRYNVVLYIKFLNFQQLSRKY